MKRFLSFLLLSAFFISMTVSILPTYASSLQDSLYVGSDTGPDNAADTGTSKDDVTIKDNFLKTIQVYLLWAYVVVTIGSMIFIGFRLFTAKGDPEEFKKAWIALIYVVVGLTIAPLAYAVVRIVTGFNF